ncbi:MAG: hypothetical protein PHG81_00075 [Aliarcobacter sp.]|nr:hypothetical protein [Aliarcobacter sp.]
MIIIGGEKATRLGVTAGKLGKKVGYGILISFVTTGILFKLIA